MYQGVIVSEEELERKGPLETAPGSFLFQIHLKIQIKIPQGKSDPLFKVNVDAPSFIRDNERITLNISCTRNAYIYVFSVDEKDKVWPVFPNSIDAENWVGADGTITLPTQAMKRAGMILKGEVPEGLKETSETLRVVAVKKKVEALVLTNKNFLDIIRNLVELDKSDWTLETVSYRIEK